MLFTLLPKVLFFSSPGWSSSSDRQQSPQVVLSEHLSQFHNLYLLFNNLCFICLPHETVSAIKAEPRYTLFIITQPAPSVVGVQWIHCLWKEWKKGKKEERSFKKLNYSSVLFRVKIVVKKKTHQRLYADYTGISTLKKCHWAVDGPSDEQVTDYLCDSNVTPEWPIWFPRECHMIPCDLDMPPTWFQCEGS